MHLSICLGVGILANFLKKFQALLSLEIESKRDSDITDSLEIHSNVLRFQSKETNAPLELILGKTMAANVNPSKLKGHNLSPHTMQYSLPSFLLQIYSNPSMYWLHQPAFYVLLQRSQRLDTPKDGIIEELERLKRIFSSEFVTRKNNADQNSEQIVDIMNSIKATENVELADLLLASILPFIFCYFNVVEVIRDRVRICSLCINICPFSKFKLTLSFLLHFSYQQSHSPIRICLYKCKCMLKLV